ncbi:unnamed protein product [Candidula unifasciata]|uniref:Zinc transporter 2 n=1 Tax=Candidula unifasciata TaxID=100452 RepID=A0A8S3Z653_9EUPU|nr:unnamed protein product [Candidula unifasciata]
MEEGMQSYQDPMYFTCRSRRHCHKPLDPSKNVVARRQLLSVTILCLLFMGIEATGGVLANSLALFSDVLHLGSDLINFLVCLSAHWLASKPMTQKMTFGYHRAEILGAFFSVIFIWVVSGVLCYIAADRIVHGHYTQVKPDEMLVTAAMGLLFNIIISSVVRIFAYNLRITSDAQPHSLHHKTESDKEEDKATQKTQQPKKPRNINVRAAFIHVIGDTIQSLGVLLSALVIKFAPSQAYKLADPICTFVFSLVVLITTMAILRDVITVFMEGVPRGIGFASLKKDLEDIDGVVTVHSLHIWALTMDTTAVSVHLVIEHLHQHDEVLAAATRLIQDKHQVHFTTIQVELFRDEMNACEDCLRFNQ